MKAINGRARRLATSAAVSTLEYHTAVKSNDMRGYLLILSYFYDTLLIEKSQFQNNTLAVTWFV